MNPISRLSYEAFMIEYKAEVLDIWAEASKNAETTDSVFVNFSRGLYLLLADGDIKLEDRHDKKNKVWAFLLGH